MIKFNAQNLPVPAASAVPAAIVSSPVAGPLGGVPLSLPSTGLASPSVDALASAVPSHFEPPPPPVFSTSFKSVLPPVRDYRRIKTENLHQFAFYLLMPVSSFSVRALLHPMTVVKTRMMVISVPTPVAAASFREPSTRLLSCSLENDDCRPMPTRSCEAVTFFCCHVVPSRSVADPTLPG